MNSISPAEPYLRPEAEEYLAWPCGCLAASNTETIDDDEQDINWD